MTMPDLPRVAAWLRMWADRFDDDGAPKRAAGLSFTFEAGKGIVVREDGNGCPLYYIRKTDYERAHHEADSHDPIKQEVTELLDAVDSGDDLPPGWTLGGTAGREEDRRRADLRCSECGRPYTDEPCGFVHAGMRMQVALIRQITGSIMRGGRRG